MSRTMAALRLSQLFLIAQAGLRRAAEIKVFSTIGVQAALEELAPKFEKATGNKLAITWARLRCWSSACRPANRPTLCADQARLDYAHQGRQGVTRAPMRYSRRARMRWS